MKFSPNCKTQTSEWILIILGSFCSFLNWEGGGKSGLGKSLVPMDQLMRFSYLS